MAKNPISFCTIPENKMYFYERNSANVVSRIITKIELDKKQFQIVPNERRYTATKAVVPWHNEHKSAQQKTIIIPCLPPAVLLDKLYFRSKI